MADRREALEAAFDEIEARDAGNDEQDPNPGLGAEEPIEDANVATEPPAEEPSDDPDAPVNAGKVRDPVTGKFTAKPNPAGKVPPEEQVPPKGVAKPAVAPGQQAEAPKYKAPGGWKIGPREKFNSLPPDVQEEVNRRETEMAQFMERTSQARNYADSVYRTIQPYEAMIRAEGSDHVKAVDALLKTAYHLRHADPQTKAQMVAQMIMQHRVDINLLDESISQMQQGGGGAQQRIDPMMQHIQQQLQPVTQFMQQIQQQAQLGQQQIHQQAQSEYDAFANDPKNIYFKDVEADMGDIMMAAANRGVQMTMADAYRRATLAHPEISQRVLASQASASAAQRSAAARRARNASASLPSGGAPTGAADQNAGKPKDRRSAIEAAWDAAEARDS